MKTALLASLSAGLIAASCGEEEVTTWGSFGDTQHMTGCAEVGDNANTPAFLPYAIAGHPWCGQRAAIADDMVASGVDFFVVPGDIVDKAPWKTPGRYENMVAALAVLPDGMIVPGNHDAPSFDYPWYREHFGEVNTSTVTSINGVDVLVIGLEYDPAHTKETNPFRGINFLDDALATWTGPTIVVTHSMGCKYNRCLKNEESGFQGAGARLLPHLKAHCSIFIVLSGHTSGSALHEWRNDCGDTTLNMVVNYQTEDEVLMDPSGAACMGPPSSIQELGCTFADKLEETGDGWISCAAYHAEGGKGCGDGWWRYMEWRGQDTLRYRTRTALLPGVFHPGFDSGDPVSSHHGIYTWSHSWALYAE